MLQIMAIALAAAMARIVSLLLGIFIAANCTSFRSSRENFHPRRNPATWAAL